MENPVAELEAGGRNGEDETRPTAFSTMGVSQANLLMQHRKSFYQRNRVYIFVAIGVLAVVCAAVAIVVVVTKQKQGMAVPDRFSASFTSTSRYDASISWTGNIHKTTDASGSWVVQGYATLIRGDVKTIVTMLNSRVYIQEFNATTNAPLSDSCQQPGQALPLGDLSWVFANAVPVGKDDSPVISAPGCAGVEKYSLQWGTPTADHRNDYTFCTLASGKHELAGSEFVASLFDVTTDPAPLSLTVPTNSTSGQPMDCPELPLDAKAFSDPATASRRLALVSSGYDIGYKLPINGRIPPKSAAVYVPPQHCVLVGGMGSSTPFYWGDLRERTDYCGAWSTLNVGDWRTDARELCNVANELTDVTIISHGTGSLLVAYAISSGECSVGSNFKWVSSQPAIAECPMADVAASDPTFCSMFVDVGSQLGVCKNHEMLESATFDSHFTNSAYTNMLQAHRSYASAVMCGVSSMGVLGDAIMFSAALYASPGVQSDGLLPAQACATSVPSSASFGLSSEFLYYGAMTNHLDGSCRNGDAFVDPFLVASPCSWIANALDATLATGS